MRGAWWWIDRWQKSTGYKDLTLEEQGAYRNLLDELWLRDGVLPNDERVLAKVCGDASAWPRVRDRVMAHFTLTDRGWRNETHDSVAKESKRLAVKQQRYRDRQKGNVTGNVTGHDDGNERGHVTRSPSPSPVSGSVSEREEADQKKNPALSAGADRAVTLPPIVMLWNRTVSGSPLPAVRTWSAARGRVASARLAEVPDLDLWGKAFSLLAASPHHRGQNDRGWVADIDFILQARQAPKWLDMARDGTPVPEPRTNGKPGGGMTTAQILEYGRKLDGQA